MKYICGGIGLALLVGIFFIIRPQKKEVQMESPVQAEKSLPPNTQPVTFRVLPKLGPAQSK